MHKPVNHAAGLSDFHRRLFQLPHSWFCHASCYRQAQDKPIQVLAYLIDSTAAPICIIAPISSWAAAVAGFVKEENGISIFVQSIPFNFYALLTLAMMVFIIFMKLDYGPMLQHENNARQGDLFTAGKNKLAVEENRQEEKVRPCVRPYHPHHIPHRWMCYRHDIHRWLLWRQEPLSMPLLPAMPQWGWYLALPSHSSSPLPIICCASRCHLANA